MERTRRSLLLKIRDTSDHHAWREFSQTYQPVIITFIRGKGVPEQDAADIAQEVFLIVVRKLEELEHREFPGSFRSWLRRVTRNKIVDWYRRRQIRRWIELTEDCTPSQSGVAAAFTDSGERTERLRHALDMVKRDVDPRTWQCFEGHVLLSRKASDVALDLRITVNAVYLSSKRVFDKVRQQCGRASQGPVRAV